MVDTSVPGGPYKNSLNRVTSDDENTVDKDQFLGSRGRERGVELASGISG